MEWLIRIDTAIEFGRYEITEEGYLRVAGVAARVGPMDYKAADGRIRVEMVDEDTLRTAADGLAHKPLTYEHPPEGMLNAKNIRQYQVGEVLSSEFNEDTGENEVEVEIRDADAVKAVLDKKVRGLSPGYKLRREPATDADAGYHYIQRQRKYNHLAITTAPRAGEATSLRLDSDGHAIVDQDKIPMDPEELKELLDAHVDSVNKAVGEALSDFAEKLEARDESAPEPAPESATDSDDADEDEDDFAERFQTHREALEVAESLGVEVEATDSTDEVRRKVAAEVVGDEVNLDSAKEGYVDALFAMAKKQADEKPGQQGPSEIDYIADAFARNRSRPNTDSDDGELTFVDPTRLAMRRGQQKNSTNQ